MKKTLGCSVAAAAVTLFSFLVTSEHASTAMAELTPLRLADEGVVPTSSSSSPSSPSPFRELKKNKKKHKKKRGKKKVKKKVKKKHKKKRGKKKEKKKNKGGGKKGGKKGKMKKKRRKKKGRTKKSKKQQHGAPGEVKGNNNNNDNHNNYNSSSILSAAGFGEPTPGDPCEEPFCFDRDPMETLYYSHTISRFEDPKQGNVDTSHFDWGENPLSWTSVVECFPGTFLYILCVTDLWHFCLIGCT